MLDGDNLFPFVADPNIRTSTHQSHSRNVLIRSSSANGASCFQSVYQSRKIPPPEDSEIKIREVWAVHVLIVHAFTDRGHHVKGVRRFHMLLSATDAEL